MTSTDAQLEAALDRKDRQIRRLEQQIQDLWNRLDSSDPEEEGPAPEFEPAVPPKELFPSLKREVDALEREVIGLERLARLKVRDKRRQTRRETLRRFLPRVETVQRAVFIMVVLAGTAMIVYSFWRTFQRVEEDPLFAVQGEDGSYGYIDAGGTMRISTRFEQAGLFEQGRAPVRLEGRWGYIDSTGVMVVQPQYEDAQPYSEGRARVLTKGLYYFLNLEGNVSSGPYLQAGRYREGLAPVLKTAPAGQFWGFVDPDGRIAIDPQWTAAYPFSEDQAIVHIPGTSSNEEPRRAFINRTGEIVIRCALAPAKGRTSCDGEEARGRTFLNAWAFADGVAAVRLQRSGRWGAIDKQGLLVVDDRFEALFNFKDRRAAFRKGSAWGYIDTRGSEVVPAVYQEAKPFSEGLGAVRQGPLWGYVNMDGVLTVPPAFSAVEPFQNGLARVSLTGGTADAYIDRTGRQIWPPDTAGAEIL